MFELRNVTKRYGGEYALRDVSMEIGNGLSFITGASGSGKTTLLRIIGGMEPDYEGSVFFGRKELREITDGEKSSLYNDVIGFVWQDFNLLDERTVMENVLLPRYLKEDLGEKRALSVLKELKIADLAGQKVEKLSGGQKQRVAIARELMKEPQVILADEPTSALDRGTSEEIMDILRNLSRRRAVIVVTHDTSLIREGDNVCELDKGELVTEMPENSQSMKDGGKARMLSSGKKKKLSPQNAFALACTAFRRQPGRAAVSVLSLIVSAVLLLVPVSGAVTDSGQTVFDELFATYGEGLLDINIYDNFIGAGGTGGNEEAGPNVDVKQNIDGLFQRYRDDSRVEHVLFGQPFHDITVELDGKEYPVEGTNNVPVLNYLVDGKLPMGDGLEAAVPEGFVQMLGMSNEEIIGKEILFHGSVYNWNSGEPVNTPMEAVVKVTGVVNTDMVTEYNGQIYRTPMSDSFFFSPAALAAMRESAGMKEEPGIIYVRCKTPEDLIAIKDELNAEGIVPLGRFELVEDMVRLNQQTSQQTGTAVWVIGVLSLTVALAAAVITAVMRRREFAIEKVSGFAPGHLAGMIGAETLLQAGVAAVLFFVLSPFLDMGTKALWEVTILTPDLLLCGAVLCVLLSVLDFAVTAAAAAAAKTQNCLKTGEK